MPETKQSLIVNEIRDALASGDTLTSAELSERCHTALDSTDISRVIGDLRAAGLVAQAGTKKSPANRTGQAKAWAWVGPVPMESIEDEAPVVEVAVDPDTLSASRVEVTPEEETVSIGKPIGYTYLGLDEQSVDPTELALADLVDQVDESVLSFADTMLSDHPTWVRLRQMQDDAFQLLCDYRLTKTLEQP
jgi:hypothetical protein